MKLKYYFCRYYRGLVREHPFLSTSSSSSRRLHVWPKKTVPNDGDKQSLSAVNTVDQLLSRRNPHHYNYSWEKTLRFVLASTITSPTLFAKELFQRNQKGLFLSFNPTLLRRQHARYFFFSGYCNGTVNGNGNNITSVDKMNNQVNQLNQAKNIWRKADAICFDVDSTVIQDEAIDELAKFCGKGDEVELLTREAMKGGMDFREALALRLDIIRPSMSQLRNFILSSKARLTPYVKELVHELHKRQKEVYLVSGGFRSIIIPLAQDLHIPTANVYANKIKFYYDGEYAGFDKNQMTSRTGGKGAVVRNLKEKHGYETVVMVGDGITDWEASPPADLFIGFGGNAYRQEVKSKSKWYVTDFRDLINELKD